MSPNSFEDSSPGKDVVVPSAKCAKSLTKALELSRIAAFNRLASQITPRIYLSDYWSARDTGKLESLGITHIVSVVEFTPDLPDIIPQDQRLHIRLADVAKAPILDHLDVATAFISKVLAENDANIVLVHCMAGVSRSATVVCAYLVATTELSAPKSIEHVQSIRGIVRPNSGFRRQLDEYSTRYAKLKPQISVPDVFKSLAEEQQLEYES